MKLMGRPAVASGSRTLRPFVCTAGQCPPCMNYLQPFCLRKFQCVSRAAAVGYKLSMARPGTNNSSTQISQAVEYSNGPRIFRQKKNRQKVERESNFLCFPGKRIPLTWGRGSPFIMPGGHFYIPKLPSNIWNIPSIFCAKMSIMVTPLA